MNRMLIEEAHAADRKVGICGEAPSNDPEFAAFSSAPASISLSPDSVVKVVETIAEVEQK